MENPRVVFKRANMELARQFYGPGAPIRSFKGYVAMIEDRVIGVAGLFYCGDNIILFSDMKDEFRSYKKDIVKSILKMREFMKGTKHPICAIAQCGEMLSEKILLKLGFIYHGESPGGKVFIRRP
jgi:hypothetical protein